MRIEDIPLSEVQRLWELNRGGRSRSPDTVRLIKGISSLRPGKALSMPVEDGQSIESAKARVENAAKTAAVSLKVVADRDNQRVLFELLQTTSD